MHHKQRLADDLNVGKVQSGIFSSIKRKNVKRVFIKFEKLKGKYDGNLIMSQEAIECWAKTWLVKLH